MTLHKGETPIRTLADWKSLAPPKSEGQWKPDRSAMEVARAWLGVPGVMPREVLAVLESHSDFGPPVTWAAEPEAKLRFDSFAGEPRNTDLAVEVEDRHGRYLLAVEAKADEPFANTIAGTLAAALKRKLKNPRSNGVTRIEQLTAAILGEREPAEPDIAKLRYQLLTASAGALCEAQRRECNRAILLIQKFVTSRSLDEKHRRNDQDLQQFLRRLAHEDLVVKGSDFLYGPFVVPGQPLLKVNVQFYVGQVTHDLRVKEV